MKYSFNHIIFEYEITADFFQKKSENHFELSPSLWFYLYLSFNRKVNPRVRALLKTSQTTAHQQRMVQSSEGCKQCLPLLLSSTSFSSTSTTFMLCTLAWLRIQHSLLKISNREAMGFLTLFWL